MSLPADGGRELVHQPRAPRPWSGACLSARALLSPGGAPWDQAPSAHHSHLLWSAPHGGSVPSLSRLPTPPTPSRGIPRWRSRFLRHHAVPTPGHSGLPTPSPSADSSSPFGSPCTANPRREASPGHPEASPSLSQTFLLLLPCPPTSSSIFQVPSASLFSDILFRNHFRLTERCRNTVAGSTERLCPVSPHPRDDIPWDEDQNPNSHGTGTAFPRNLLTSLELPQLLHQRPPVQGPSWGRSPRFAVASPSVLGRLLRLPRSSPTLSL